MTSPAPLGARHWLGPELRGQLALAGPLCLSTMGQQLLSVVDSAMLGRYSAAALAGGGVGGSLYFAVTVLGMGTVMGLDTLVPQALGAGERARASSLYRAGLRVALLAGAVLALLCALSLLALDAVGAEPEIREQARGYLLARAPSALPFLMATAARSFLQAHGRTRPIVVAAIAGNVCNVIGNALLIFGDESLVSLGLPAIGLPALGVVGAGLTSTLVSVVTMAVLLASARAADEPEPPRRGDALRIAILGLPVGGQLMLEVGIFATASALASRLSTVAAAAHHVGLTIASFSFSIALGLGASASVRVGHAVGQGDALAARRAGVVAASLGASSMGAVGIVFVCVPELLAQGFSDDPAVIAAALPLLRIAALFQLFDATQAVMAGALRGAGDTRSTLWGNLFGHYVIGLPVMLLLAFHIGMGASGLWWGLCAGLTVTAVVLAIRFSKISHGPIRRA